MEYENVISLGYFCSVAKDLERIGLRNFSSPFDWTISDFKGVLQLIDNDFEGFFEYENLEQSSTLHQVYRDSKYNIEFFHDFDPKRDLKKQYKKVRKKYERRIRRFYNKIQNTTLFIRYIESQDELEYIENNIEFVYNTIKKSNSNNELIFIGNKELMSEKIKIYKVEKDINDAVARKPLEKNVELWKFLNEMPYKYRDVNMQKFLNKTKKNKNIMRKVIGKVKGIRKEYLIKEKKDFIYVKQFNKY